LSLEKIIETRKKLLLDKKAPTEQELKEGYQLFQEKFHPDKIKNLKGETLLDSLFNLGNRNSLVYWLEFKNDDEFRTVSYGSISGGSAYKYIIFKRNSDGTWITGSGQNPVELTVDEAIETATKIRDNLLLGAELFESILGKDTAPTEADYIQLQTEFTNQLELKMSSLGWVHKYFHMIYPNFIDDFHNMDWQKSSLIKLKVKPVSPPGLYTWGGQVMLLSKEVNMTVNHYTHCVNMMFGGPHEYMRVGTTSDSKSYWVEMYNEGYVSIGWPKLGNLERFEDMKVTEMKNQLKSLLEEFYPQAPNVITKWANQISMFFTRLMKGTIVVAAEGEKVLGIGKVIGDYKYMEGKDFPHTIKTEWIATPNTKLPNSKEGLQTTVHALKDIDNFIAIEKLLAEPKNEAFPATTVALKLEKLSEMTLKIEGILNRKKQVILYGPPGTGKTFHAEKTCYELSARQIFKKSFHQLTNEEKVVINGNLSQPGTVRMCTFHPSYGYEDFIEGIKPTVVNNSTLFNLKDGIFKSLCNEASSNPSRSYYIIIDEINRGDISRIFGELITIIESNKRGKKVILPLSNEVFSVPDNVHIIGTMNTADRSIALLDVALRRRFGFIELMPDYSLLDGVSIENLPLAEWLKALNRRIVESLGQDARNLQIGHSYFLEKEKPIGNPNKFSRIIEEDIIPLIEEYCYGDYKTIEKILGSGLVDLKSKSIKYDVFAKDNIETLVHSLLESTPELSTENLIISPEDEEEEAEVFETTGSKLAD
jgi:5-methylcytosine-specific restriction enzyme B